jgi:alkanesulfonate monooxygenase SsuD/methylene tetrahydromethanopterin reductase-like flavin-dependent oxidoreductase (luciferase family)
VKVGLILPLFSGDPAKVLAAAREAESLGFDGVFAFDHFFPPGGPRDRPALEAFASLAGVVAVTRRVKVGTLVARANLRPPGLLAKAASWLDTASGGRMVLGIGTGDPIDRPEHDAYGLPMLNKRDRRTYLEETVTAAKALFAGKSYPGGSWIPPLSGPLKPSPSRPGGPPVWIGAQADDVVRLAGRIADGWNGWGLDPSAFARKVAVLRGAAGGHPVEASWAGIVLAGADRAETESLLERRRARGMDDEAWVGSTDELVRFMQALAEAGAGWVVMVLAGPADRRHVLAERVLPAIRSPSMAD